MTTPKRTRIQIRNEALILECAQAAFATHGFKGATVERIAKLADMSQPNLHRYFKTKADLYNAVLQHTLDIWLEPIGGLNATGDPADELRRYISRKLGMSRQFPNASRVFAHEMLEGASGLKPHLAGRVRDKAMEFASILDGWAAAGKVRPVDPYHLLFLVWGATQHYADFAPQVQAVLGVSRLTHRHFQQAENTLTGILLNGLLI